MRSYLLASLIVAPVLVTACAVESAELAQGTPEANEATASTEEALAGYNLAAPPETTAIDAFVGDFDNDGKADVARWLPTNQWDITKSCGADFAPQIWNGAWGSDGPIHIGDFNGDHRSDLIMWRDSNKDWTVNLSNGNTDFTAPIWTGDWGSDGQIFVGDVNGDHKSDVFMSRDSNHDWTMNISTGSGFKPAIWTGAWGSDGPIHVGDLNGDGKTDVFMWRSSDKVWTVNLSNGSNWVGQIWHGAWGSDGEIHVGDLNGDGKTDVFMFRPSDNTWSVNLSTGTGFTSQTWYGDWGTDGPINVGDLNGDGKSDVFMWRNADKVWTVNISTGTGFTPAIWHGAWGSDGPIHVADVNGDGKADVLMHAPNDTWSVNLSTGSNFNGRAWWSKPPTKPVINAVYPVPYYANPGTPIAIAYDVTVPQGCNLTGSYQWVYNKDYSPVDGHGEVPFAVDPSGKGTVSVDTKGQPGPLTYWLGFRCQANACPNTGTFAYDIMAVLPPVGPASPKINSFTVSPNDHDSHIGYTCYGLNETLSWNVSFPGSGCSKPALTMSATDDDDQGRTFLTATNLAASGSLVEPALTNAHYKLLATCKDDGQTDTAALTVSITVASACGGQKPPSGDWYCYKAVGKASHLCSTKEIFAASEGDAEKLFDGEFPKAQFDDESIECSEVTSACPDL